MSSRPIVKELSKRGENFANLAMKGVSFTASEEESWRQGKGNYEGREEREENAGKK